MLHLTSASGTNSGVTVAGSAMTFGSSVGGAYVLFVEIESSGVFSTPGTITYNGVAMSNLGGSAGVTYTGQDGTAYRSLYYVANPVSGGPLTITSGSTALGGSYAWIYRWWTYSNVLASRPSAISALTLLIM